MHDYKHLKLQLDCLCRSWMTIISCVMAVQFHKFWLSPCAHIICCWLGLCCSFLLADQGRQKLFSTVHSWFKHYTNFSDWFRLWSSFCQRAAQQWLKRERVTAAHPKNCDTYIHQFFSKLVYLYTLVQISMIAMRVHRIVGLLFLSRQKYPKRFTGTDIHGFPQNESESFGDPPDKDIALIILLIIVYCTLMTHHRDNVQSVKALMLAR